MNYRIINKDTYYRKGVFRHFSEDCKCSTSMTARIDVTELVNVSRQTGTKFYINSSSVQNRHGNIVWIWKIIRTGLMLPIFHGFLMIH